MASVIFSKWQRYFDNVYVTCLNSLGSAYWLYNLWKCFFDIFFSATFDCPSDLSCDCTVNVVWPHPVKNASSIKNITSPLQVKWPCLEWRNVISCYQRWPLKMATSGPLTMKVAGWNLRNVPITDNSKSITHVKTKSYIKNVDSTYLHVQIIPSRDVKNDASSPPFVSDTGNFAH